MAAVSFSSYRLMAVISEQPTSHRKGGSGPGRKQRKFIDWSVCRRCGRASLGYLVINPIALKMA